MSFRPEAAPTVSYLGMLFSAIINPMLLVCTYICIRMFDIVHGSFQVLSMEAIIIIYCFNTIYKYRGYVVKYINATLLFGVFAFLSALFGYQTSITSLIPFIFLFFIFLTIGTMKLSSQEDMIIVTLCVCGVVVGLFGYYQFISGDIFSESGRLGFDGSIRRVSNAVAFPLFYAVYKLLNKPKGFNIVLWSLLILLLGTVLILTYSRGVILAVIITAVFLFLFSKGEVGFTKVVLTLVSGGLVFFIINSVNIDSELMFRELDTASGRTDIWDYYNSKMAEGGFMRILFGFGPGDTMRVAANSAYQDFYAHSLFLDFFYCFGILGAVCMLYILIILSRTIIKEKSIFYIAVLVLSITMYLTHGIASQIHFYCMLGLCLGEAVYTGKKVTKARMSSKLLNHQSLYA